MGTEILIICAIARGKVKKIHAEKNKDTVGRSSVQAQGAVF